MKSTHERLDKLSTEMAELTKSLEHTQDQLDDKLKTIKTDIKNLEAQSKKLSKKLKNTLIETKSSLNSKIGQGEITSI